ncbi:MAG: laminin B domain-containing protein [Betaproteobacteria bacterium]
MNRHVFPAGLALIGALVAAPSHAAVSSTFDADADGWSAVDLVYNGDYLAAGTLYAVVHGDGGNPGGNISAADPSDQSFFFQAPGKFLGNLGAYYGGSLAFDQRVIPATPEWRDDPDVILGGNGLQLLFRGASNPDTNWTSFSVALNESAWHLGTLDGTAPTEAQFRSVLGDLTVLRIRGEYVAGVVETTSLDNVVLTAVPEPGTWALLGAGLGLIGWQARRRG